MRSGVRKGLSDLISVIEKNNSRSGKEYIAAGLDFAVLCCILLHS